MRLRRAAVALAALGALAGVSLPAHANAPDVFGVGSRETAMGNAVAADVRGVSANYYNPAALVRSPALELSLGYFHASHDLEINGRDTGVDPVKGITGGFVVPGRLLGVPFAFGLGIHLPDDRISRVRSLRQEQPRWELYDNRNQRLFFAANLAIQPLPWLQIGGGLSFMASTRGRLDISGSANIFHSDDSQLRHEVDADLAAVRYPQAGMRVELSERVALAAVYRGQFKLALDLHARIAGDISQITTALLDLETHSINNFLPQQGVLGASWLVTRDLRATFDATWINWSAYESPVARLGIIVDIPPPAGGWPASITPPTNPSPTKVAALRLHDRVVPHLGCEWRAFSTPKLEGFLRGGYEVAKSPFEAQTGLTNFVDRDRHTVSFGIGTTVHHLAREVPGSLSIDAHLQWSELVNATTLKSDPSDLVGDYTARGRIIAVGVSTTFAFDGAKR